MNDAGNVRVRPKRYRGRQVWLEELLRQEREAVAEALREVRELWLSQLEAWRAEDGEIDIVKMKPGVFLDALAMEAKIRSLRRQLGIRPTDDERRAQTRERVRRHRERKRQGA
jgi:hypothetical protein